MGPKAFRGDRLRDLLHVKGLSPGGLKGFTRENISRWENSTVEPTPTAIRDLALALDATSDFLLGIGEDYGEDASLAAARMAFAYFDRESDTAPELKARCRLIFEDDELLRSHGAPRCAEDWATVAKMLKRGTPQGPTPIRTDPVVKSA